MVRLAGAACALLAAWLATGCTRPAQEPEAVRPVRVQRVGGAVAASTPVYAGEVRARYESALAFRVAGKLVSRHVEVGQVVARGKVIARLDAGDLRLSEAALRAQLAAAQTEFDLAASELKRTRELRARNFISDAEVDRRVQQVDAANARLSQFRAQLAQGGNQSSYAELVADADGVITALAAESGQVVAAGQEIARLARLEHKDVVINVPEHRIGEMVPAGEVEVRLWAHPDKVYAGRIREIAPGTDPVTRTFTVKVALPPASGTARLGMTATATPAARAAAVGMVLPMAALHEIDKAPALWVVDVKNSTVHPVPVTLGAFAGNDLLVESGLEPGALVVIAGVHLLKPGQKVRLLDDAK